MAKRSVSLLLTASLGAASIGCATPPQSAIDAARRALSAARAAEAQSDALESLTAAEDAVAQLEAELLSQEQKSLISRSYAKTRRLAHAAQAAANKAALDAAAGTRRTELDATTAIESTREAVGQVRGAVPRLPKTKAGEAARVSIDADLADAETSVGEAETALVGGKPLEARTRAQGGAVAVARARVALDQALKPPATPAR
jgi:hypothetical protein